MLLTEFTTLLKNLWEELMNNIKKYIKNIWTIMPMHTKKEKFYLNELKKLEEAGILKFVFTFPKQ